MSFVLRLIAVAWLLFGLLVACEVRANLRGAEEQTILNWITIFMVIAPSVVLFMIGNWCASRKRVSEMAEAIERARKG